LHYLNGGGSLESKGRHKKTRNSGEVKTMNALFHRFYKLFVAAGMVIVVAASSTQAQAITLGLPGDALLVPFVLYSGQGGIDINTRIYIKCPKRWRLPDGTITTVPAGVNFDNELQDTDGDGAREGNGDDGMIPVAGLRYHWFFFGADGTHRVDFEGVCIPDDMDLIDWAKVDSSFTAGALEDVPGYIVITNDTPPRASPPGSVGANFVMHGNASMSFGPLGVRGTAAIPVIPLSDTPDATTAPVEGDNVVYENFGIGIPSVSPIDHAMRMNDGNGIDTDLIFFDMILGQKNLPGTSTINLTPSHDTMHVIWLDRSSAGRTANIDVFDGYVNQCSSTVDLGVELNLVYIQGQYSENLTQFKPSGGRVDPRIICNPSAPVAPTTFPDPLSAAKRFPRYVRYDLREVGDELGGGRVDSAAVAFSLILNEPGMAMLGASGVLTTDSSFNGAAPVKWLPAMSGGVETLLAHEYYPPPCQGFIGCNRLTLSMDLNVIEAILRPNNDQRFDLNLMGTLLPLANGNGGGNNGGNESPGNVGGIPVLPGGLAAMASNGGIQVQSNVATMASNGGFDLMNEDTIIRFGDFSHTIAPDEWRMQRNRYIFRSRTSQVRLLVLKENGDLQLRLVNLDPADFNLSEPIMLSIQIGDQVGIFEILFDDNGNFPPGGPNDSDSDTDSDSDSGKNKHKDRHGRRHR